MRTRWAALSAVLVIVLIAVAAGCVESSEDEARTPSDSPTVVNSALQTDSNGDTVTAPAATAPEGGETTGGETNGGEGAAGDAAAGLTFFQATCTGCHTDDGKKAGVGPALVGIGWSADQIRTQVENGGGVMPGGLATGADLDNVVAYVLSLQ
ncbi:MAG: cytochrome c [Thermoleophilia bacterium]